MSTQNRLNFWCEFGLNRFSGLEGWMLELVTVIQKFYKNHK